MEYSFFPKKNLKSFTKIQNFKKKMLALVYFKPCFISIHSFIYWILIHFHDVCNSNKWNTKFNMTITLGLS